MWDLDRYHKWKSENLDHWKQYHKEYREKHREKQIAYLRNYVKTHKNESSEYHKKWYEHKRISILFRRQLTHKSLIKLLGGKCVRCKSQKDLEIDHIWGGGGADRAIRFLKSNDRMYRYYLAHPNEAKDELQILCSFHNLEKRIMRNEHGSIYRKKWNSHYKHNK